ncbi:MAG TPA: hypothetical protein VN627_12280 [Novosphingobium sp.]|nr:hypothetical protein [Novosphingobium sp.]
MTTDTKAAQGEAMSFRLRFWLAAMDLASLMRLPRPIYLWCVVRASNATDWGDGNGARP